MGKQSRAKRERRMGRGKTKELVPCDYIAPGELAAAERDRQRAAIHRHFVETGVWGRVQAVVEIMKSDDYVMAQSKAFSRADLSVRPPRTEDDVREIIVDVLRGEPFNADLRDVLLKVRVDHRTKRLSVSAGPGIEAARAALAAAEMALAPKLSESAVAAG